MSKPKFALSLLVLPFVFQAIEAQVAETKAGTATVSGRVTLKGEPARGVTVILPVQNNSDATNAPRVRTDENGRFHFTGVAAGGYSIYALAPGYVSPGEGMSIIRRGQPLNVAEGEKVENVAIEIKRGGVIAGRVTDSQGRPVIEEFINLVRLDRNNRPQNYTIYSPIIDMIRTDDRGAYRVYGLPEGRYLVSVGRAQTPGSTGITSSREFYPRVFYPDVSNESEAKMIEISEGSEASDIDITIPDPKRTYDVSGRVVDAGTGKPVAGMEVGIGGLTSDGRYGGGFYGVGTWSGPNGEFRVFGVVPGRYAILVSPDDLARRSELIGEPVIFDISEGDATGVEIRLRRGASISGVASIEGTTDPKVLSRLSRVGILAFISTGPNPPAPMNGRPVRINADGSFRLSGLQAGKAMITVATPSDLRGLRVGRVEFNGATAPEGIDLEAGQQVTGVRVVLLYVHGALTLRGEAKIIGGAFPAGQMFRVVARRVDQQAQNTSGGEVDARGQFLIENLAPGEYEISVFPVFNNPGAQLDPKVMRLFSTFKERVVVADGNQQPVSIVIDLTR